MGVIDNNGKWLVEPTAELSMVGNDRTETLSSDDFIRVKYKEFNLFDVNKNEFLTSQWNVDLKNYLLCLVMIVDGMYSEDLIFLQTDYYPVYGKDDKVVLKEPTNGIDVTTYGYEETKTGFYDRNHKLVIDMSQYEKKRRYHEYKYGAIAIGGFSGGYCMIAIENPQGDVFYTVIDKTGKRMFEPIRKKIDPVSCERIYVEPTDREPGYFLDVNGKTVISNVNSSNFSEAGLALVKNLREDKTVIDYYYINTAGETAF